MKTATIILGVLALVTGYFAWKAPAQLRSADLGKQMTTLGKEAPTEQIASLSVATWDAESDKLKVFEVRKEGKGWIIPSHFDYPADGASRVGNTAGLLGTQRGKFVTDDPKLHEQLGVIDPKSPAAETAKERGKRITIKDQAGAALLDLIVGKTDNDGGGGSFVREVDSNEVYTAKLNADVSTKFVDWVMPDLLKVTPADLRGLTVSSYQVDEVNGQIKPGDETAVARATESADWTSPQAPADQRPAKEGVDKIVNELTGLKLVGIRPFSPEWLQPRGFFFSQDPRFLDKPDALALNVNGQRVALIGNEGELGAVAKDGMSYKLYFGEIAVGEDQDSSAETAKLDAAKGADGKPAAKDGNNRYMAVFCTYDPTKDQTPVTGEKDEDKEKSRKANAEAGAKKAEKLSARFAKFFYVISDSSFKNLRPAKDSLFEAKPPEPQAGKSGKTNSAWLAENGKKPGVTTTASGLQYEVVSRGPEGGKAPTDADRVSVHYKGTLVDGEVFDESKGGPTEFGVTQVIKGWTEGLKLMHEGDKFRFVIPSELGYGEAGQGEKIPAHSILVFEVELVKVLP
ncbi:MAG: FKBP-type peptidyl-prolyl cis-trans isomerase [Planctomycetes bacterium]|nr:FKBP-type peptidyl-prolyl cis-trans isomerase [Planctomycetota bacterium]